MEYIELCFITVTQINELGNPKTRKTKDVPMSCEVSIIIPHKHKWYSVIVTKIVIVYFYFLFFCLQSSHDGCIVLELNNQFES